MLFLAFILIRERNSRKTSSLTQGRITSYTVIILFLILLDHLNSQIVKYDRIFSFMCLYSMMQLSVIKLRLSIFFLLFSQFHVILSLNSPFLETFQRIQSVLAALWQPKKQPDIQRSFYSQSRLTCLQITIYKPQHQLSPIDVYCILANG